MVGGAYALAGRWRDRPVRIQCTEASRPFIQGMELMARADLIVATGGQPMVRAAYSSGTPAYGVGAGNSTMIIDETANIEEAARNTRLSKTSDFGSGCSADGNLIIEASIFDAMLAQLQKDGPVQGNLDPMRVVAGGAALREGIDAILQVLGQGPLIFNLGHGILPDTPIANVERLVARVRGVAS